MRKLLLLVSIFILISKISFSQKYFDTEPANQAGPFIMATGGINASEPTLGFNNGFGFTLPDIGVFGRTVLDPDNKLGVYGQAYYSRVAYELLADVVGAQDNTYKFTYIAFGVGLDYNNFYLGMDGALPIGGERKVDGKSVEIQSGLMKFDLQLNIGWSLNLADVENTGELRLVTMARYSLLGVYNDDQIGQGTNENPFTLSLGLNFLFNFDDTVY
jgi:hypothetical protein